MSKPSSKADVKVSRSSYAPEASRPAFRARWSWKYMAMRHGHLLARCPSNQECLLRTVD